MPDCNHEYLATRKDSRGNRCEAILAIVQSGDGRITGRYVFTLLGAAVPDGWRFPAGDAVVDGKVFSDRTFPFENATDAGIAKWQAAEGAHGLHARLTIGSATLYVLMLDTNSRTMVLCDRDDIGEVALPTLNDFEDFSLDPRDQPQLARRLQLFRSWLDSESEPALRAKVETLAGVVEAQAAQLQAFRDKHLAIEPRRPGQHTDFSDNYRHVADNSYTGEFVEGTMELKHSTITGEITGHYWAPSAISGSVSWPYPTVSGPVTGHAFPDRHAWHFADAAALSSWANMESYLGLPGGLREARIEFCGLTRYLLRTADGCLAMSDRESVTDCGLIWPKAEF